MKVQDLTGVGLEVKRLYVDIEKVEIECPHCGEKNHLESHQYLSYPTIGKASSMYTECNGCEGGIQVDVTLHAHLEIGEPNKEEE